MLQLNFKKKFCLFTSESLGPHGIAPFNGKVAWPILAILDIKFALCDLVLERASFIEAPRALIVDSSALRKKN